jgi:hypothetical protein
MKDAQKPDHVSLNTLISRMKDGRFVVPDFQREFEWRPSDIRDLIRSVFLDYYIGSLLLWKAKPENYKALSCEPLYGHTGSDRPEYIVLDGQQRLTAMYYAFLAPDKNLPGRASRFVFFVRIDRFMAEEYDEAFGYDRLTRWRVALLKDRERQFAEHFFPLGVLGSGGWDLPNWIQGYERHWRERVAAAEKNGDESGVAESRLHVENAHAFGDHIRGITEQYQISYIELDRDLEVEKVCDIFTQINSRGVRLDVFDLVNALLKPKGLQLKLMWRDAAPRLEFVETEKMNVYILQVMSILRQNYCSPRYLYYLLPGQEKQVRLSDGTRRKEVLISGTAEFEQLWNEAVASLEAAISILRHPHEYGVLSSEYLPYVTILPVFAALQAHLRSLPPQRQLDAQLKLRHWYWSSVFTNRYSGSVESTSARDFLDVRAWFEDSMAEPALVSEFASRFRAMDLRKEVKRGTSVYNGIFNLFVLQGARDWVTGTIPVDGDLDDHHIVPASWGKSRIPDGRIHSILNRTPLASETNRHVIRDRLPNAYLKEWIQGNGEATVRAILDSHFITPAATAILLRDPFGLEDYEAFIAERQRTLQEAIENLLIKERLDLSPNLRALDARIEEVELSLRRVITGEHGFDRMLIPPHIAAKVEERISRARRRNPAIDLTYSETLDGMLEYFDLREVQDTILSKTGWLLFERRFGTKEGLSSKFNQLAELRNSIRHSRTVDEVTRLEGEAAIQWFTQVLGSHPSTP